MWSATSIPGRPTLLMVDASRNAQGWEAELCDRLFTTMRRRKLSLIGDGPVRVDRPEELAPHVGPQGSDFNAVLLLGHAGDEATASGAGLRGYWEWLSAQALAPKLLCLCTWEDCDSALAETVLKSEQTCAPLALAPQTPMPARAAGLFLLKFFTELELHSEQEITGRMVWFSWSKARELLRRRNLEGQYGVRC